jgi:hypothetical protein
MRQILLTNAGDANPLSASSVEILTELVGRCLKRERFGGPKVEFEGSLSKLSPEEFARTAIRHRVFSLISRHVEIPELWKETLRTFEQQIAIANLENLRLSDELSKKFASAGIPHTFMKGSGLSLIALGRLGLRDAPTDIDLLVDEKDIIRARKLLIELGYEPRGGASPEQPRIWRTMLLVYRELGFSKGRLNIDLHWRPADQPDLFPPTSELIDKAQVVSSGDMAIPTLRPDHALWLESLKMLQDRNFSLSNSVTVVLLTEKTGVNSGMESAYLRPLVSSAQLFAYRTLGQMSETLEQTEFSRVREQIYKIHQENWSLFSVMGLKYPSHRNWVSLPPPSEILNKLQILSFTGNTLKALKILSTQYLIRPYEGFSGNPITRLVSRLKLVSRAFRKKS